LRLQRRCHPAACTGAPPESPSPLIFSVG
jgi:hypothetical protein